MLLDMQRAPRCGARTRSGKPCQSPGMPNGRCRMHGGPSPGAPKGNQNAFKHGRYSASSIQHRRQIAALINEMREVVQAGPVK
ncbi:HGGxSTG domain-containing protein [Bradyrhizobium sp. 170]|uniref:HGGxSTG domain-containing protein n=1 Tax=Bradyrhizobium sp. 170 TaxID=2782641 RepID=UPI003211F1FA